MPHQLKHLVQLTALLAVGGVACVSPAPLPVHPPAIPIVSFRNAAALNRTERLALEIHAIDVAAWRATDRIYERGIDPDAAEVAGWIVVGKGAKRRVRFVREGEAMPVAIIDVDLDVSSTAKGSVSRSPSGASLAPEEQSMWRAQQLAIRSDWKRCPTRYNTATLRDPGGDRWLVYLLSATTESEIVVGRHYRFVVSALGDSLLETTALSNTCFRMPIEESSELYAFTQLASEEPLETSVLLGLQHEKPIYFSVPSGSIWRVDDGRLRLIRDGPAD